MKLIYFLFFLGLFGSSWGQTSGYLGMKRYVKLDYNFFPMSGLFLLDGTTPEVDFLPDYKFDFQYGKVINNNTVLELGVGYFNDNFYIYPSEVIIESSKLPLYNQGRLSSSDSIRYSPAGLTVYSANIFMKKFLFQNGGCVAPYGKYFLVGISFQNVNVSDKGAYYGPIKTDLLHQKTVSFKLGFGQHYIFNERFTFDFYTGFGFNYQGLKLLMEPRLRRESEGLYIYKKMNPIRFSTTRKLLYEDFANFRLGVGYLF